MPSRFHNSSFIRRRPVPLQPHSAEMALISIPPFCPSIPIRPSPFVLDTSPHLFPSIRHNGFIISVSRTSDLTDILIPPHLHLAFDLSLCIPSDSKTSISFRSFPPSVDLCCPCILQWSSRHPSRTNRRYSMLVGRAICTTCFSYGNIDIQLHFQSWGPKSRRDFFHTKTNWGSIRRG